MKAQSIYKFLSECDEHNIRLIELQLEFAKDLRYYQLQFAVSNEDFAKEFNCSVPQVAKLRKGATAITLVDMAKLRTLHAGRIAEEKARDKVKVE